MPSNKVKMDWATLPSYEELERTIEQHRLANPRPSIKIDLNMVDLPHDSLKAVMTLLEEWEVPTAVKLTATYSEGQQLTFWELRRPELSAWERGMGEVE